MKNTEKKAFIFPNLSIVKFTSEVVLSTSNGRAGDIQEDFREIFPLGN